jgi:hypothetical protein
VGRPDGKRPLGKDRYNLEDNIRMDIREICFGGMNWVDLTQDRDMWPVVVNPVLNIRVPEFIGNSSIAERVFASQKGLAFMELGKISSEWILGTHKHCVEF